ncbi:hypothetical protein N473_08910 [Pseudoalteromonas luteoviolacea CPMOR-1]|uniref:RNA polymerase sigma-70 ECF-like HTH domain-containing protein n=1 Tax=Pseudoalteromonas luteoviolacea CPMOR-1 TaxID=1365248 RepID=A0A162B4N3_9GAMM|nr:ECF-type sigma factor [Pseudoalteromonas luteoviolacea]KZN66501.1 hypothetical protein N473_08910 [Pseudoalteromonas luteoviolacea CPMOR-1]
MKNDITLLISKWKQGCEASEKALKSAVFLHLKSSLKKHKQQLVRNHDEFDVVPNTTSFINEYFIHFAPPVKDYESRKQYLRDVSTFIRNALISEIRKNKAYKRGNLHEHTSVEQLSQITEYANDEQYSTFDEAIGLLKTRSESCYEVALFYYFLGMTADEIGRELSLSRGKVYRQIEVANAFLRSQFMDAM